MKIGLGTAQFGLDYGISNSLGKTPIREVRRILDIASKNGIHTIDTASLYGDSEGVLGQCLAGRNPFHIVTKTPQYDGKSRTQEDAKKLESVFFESLKKLEQSSVYGLLVHRAGDLLARNGALLWDAMNKLKTQGLVKKIGVSVYSAEQIDPIIESFPIDLIQLPVNVLDQRLIDSGHLKILKNRGIEIHTRSALLQGLLLMDPSELPNYFSCVRPHLQYYHRYIGSRNISPLKSALDFVLNLEEVDVVIIGVAGTGQLEQVLCETGSGIEMTSDEYRNFAWWDEKILDPSQWNIPKQ